MTDMNTETSWIAIVGCKHNKDLNLFETVQVR